ncbi:MAG TPA: DUF2069 domain-containing protein [Cellvibrionaceae bacterium]|nr:DUF2069 domain-containing protein [Cellvibrionaceae bacterium]HMW48271.1 DUF2069 domain-containing protein [Cellvibrionaceae bacterium]HMW70231.1 DUF2069 domain-containing protein [Cellvibrionaceae bacterium]HMY38371.1 DUF2069 domain-containing protein [Marinagarivorans sp.]HNG59523.1 DUF2069 domain-containing protein [Cellvibrionaceae bacterium]
MNFLTPLQLRAAQLMAVFLLILLMSFFQLALPAGPVYKIWLLQVLPLLILIPGIYQLKRRSFQFMGFVILLYFIRSVTNVLSGDPAFIDYGILGLSVLIFFLSLMASRVLVGNGQSPATRQEEL